MARVNWHLLAITYLSLFFFGLADNARGPVFPDLLKDYQLSDFAGSWFFLISSAASLANNLLAFIWLGRLGAFRALQIYSFLQAMALFWLGFAGQGAGGYVGVLAASALFGMSTGGLGISQNLLAAEAAPAHRRRQALSGLHCMYGVSSLLAPLTVTGWYMLGGEWRRIFAWVALGSLSVSLLSLRLKPELRGSAARALSRDRSDERSGDEGLVTSQGVFWRRVGYLGATMCLYVIAEIALSTRLVLFARRDLRLPLDEANLLLSGFFLALFLGRLLVAVVALPLKNERLLTLSAALSVLFFVFGLVYHPAWLSLCGFAMSWFYPSMIALISELMGRDSARATSWCVTIQSLGLMMMHFLLGQLSDAFGLRAALWVGPICLALVLCLLVLKRRSGLFPS